MNKITEIYDGDYVVAWKDGDSVFLTFAMNGVTVSMPEDGFADIMAELAQTQASFQLLAEE